MLEQVPCCVLPVAGDFVPAAPTMCRFANALPLRQFMHRRRVLTLYRSLLRASRSLEEMDPSSGKDTRAQVTREFRRWAADTDKPHILALLADGDRQLQTLQGMLDAARLHASTVGSAGVTAASGDDSVGADASAPLRAGSKQAVPPQASVPDIVEVNTWYGQGPEDDKHGRLGTDWPWSR